MQWKRSLGVRTRILIYFLLFAAVLLVLLWLFQVVFLDDFYRMQKREMLHSSAESLVQNIDNKNLSTLAYRIAEENNVCILITDKNMRTQAAVESWPGCIIHHLNKADLARFARAAAKEENGQRLMDFPMFAFRNLKYDEREFRGRVPPTDEGDASSMLLVRSVEMSDGKELYLFLNTLVTPVSATVQTIRNELYYLSAIMVLLSFLLSVVLSRRITRPLVETTAAAVALSEGEYQPVQKTGYREIDQLNRQLVQAAKDLHKVEEMQQELLANISHDLRTPLTLIEGYAEVIRDLPDEATPENMQVIIDEARRLTTLVNSVLDLNAARNDMGALDLKAFNLTETIWTIMRRYQKLIEQDGYRILFEPAEYVTVLADEIKVQQVIYNLINNAITYTGADRTVIIRQIVRQENIRIEISDSGEGIAPEELPYLWDRYYRGKKPHKRATIGSGLGLNIVKEILDKHGLAYGVESAEGTGSTFWFEVKSLDKQETPMIN